VRAPASSVVPTTSRAAASACHCNGDEWLLSLDRARYVPGDEGAVGATRCSCADRHRAREATPGEPAVTGAAIEVRDVYRRFRRTLVLDRVSVAVPRGRIHALLGPNGAGKTTLIRILAGLLVPNSGSVRVMGIDATGAPRAARQAVGLVPSGDRSFYLRISGVENLVFFARLHGMGRKAAVGRALELLEQVGLLDAARMPVGLYSHGMQKRLSVARALLTDPPVLLVDEGTHDLDPEGAQRVRELVAAAARRGAAVLWATQRIDEIRALAYSVTLLGGGKVRFAGTVAELISRAATRHVLRLRNGRPPGEDLLRIGRGALDRRGTLWPDPAGNPDHYVLALAEDVVLGDALGTLAAAQIQVIACREERSQLEEAFLSLTREVDQ
jgi:ABC-type multidrug transport system ATPase subunit